MRTTATEYLQGASLGRPHRVPSSLVALSLLLLTCFLCVAVFLFAFYLFVLRVEMARVAVGASFADRIPQSEVRDRWPEEPFPEEQRPLLWYNNLFCFVSHSPQLPASVRSNLFRLYNKKRKTDRPAHGLWRSAKF